MSRAGDAHERELLRGLRGRKGSSTRDGKVCANHSCPDMGMVQPTENFYRHGGKVDSYCILCRRSRNSTWKFDNPKRSEGKARTKDLDLGKAPWCKEHKKNSSACGCATGIFHKSPKHRRAISKSMMGNTNAKGKSNGHGPLSEAHKLAISMTMRGRKRSRRRGS